MIALAALGLLFTGIPSASADAGPYVLQNGWSGLCLSVPGDNLYNNAPIDEWGCGPYPDQRYAPSNSGSHPGWFYLVSVQNPNYCVGFTPNTHNQLTLQWCGPNAANGSTSQLWSNYTWTYDNGQYSYPLYQAFDGQCMSVPGNNQYAGQQIFLWSCGGYPDQRWYYGGYW